MNRNFFSLLPRKSVLALTAVTLGTIALTGCGMGTASVDTPEATVIPAISGTIMGGETAVSGSKVILWETDPANSGYGVTATQLASTTSGTGGGFAFTPGSYTCAPGQFAYVTATGGDVTNGGGTINPNLVMITAIGSCSNFSSSAAEAKIVIVINELSTVAAAYALGAFTTVNDNGSNGTQLVYIGAPANNNAATGACTGTGSSMTCVAAGLKHAFANATNLVDAVHFDGSSPSGTANVTVPGNSSGSIPTAVINTLGNIVQFCTNTAGGAAGDGSNCGIFFTDATPLNATAPANTLSALINIAHFPQHGIGSSCTGTTGGLFCLSSTFASFAPFLSAVPHDWSIGIAYAGTTQGSFGIPQYVALDANDNVYVETGNLNTATQLGTAAMTSTGSAIWYNAMSANQCGQGGLATDTNGNVFLSVYASSSGACSWGIYGYSASAGTLTYQFGPGSGTVCGSATPTSATCPGFPAGGYDTVHPIQSTPNGIAIDRYNNLWYNRRSTTCANCLMQLPYTSGTGYGVAAVTEGFTAADWDGGYQLTIDSNGNVYSSTLIANVYITPNNTPGSTPTYTSSTTSANQGYLTQAAGGTTFGLAALDSAGNLWTAYANSYVELSPATSGGVITGFSPAATSPYATAGSKPQVGEFDGHDNLYGPSYSTSGLIYMQTSPSYSGYNATNNNAYTVQPCYAPASAGACSSTLSSSDPHNLQIDSTGTMWIAAQGSSAGAPGFVVQLIGTAYPVWPQLSYGKFGVEPQ